MRVVCTAGHVDHGKSSLVRALTGMEPDRLDEERRRGLTIDLGFAWTTIGHHTVAFVDLPGHERFVPTMLAGAGPVGTAVFVVAADEGWMPQSAEHLAILDLLGVADGLVVLSKADLVDDETLEIAKELVTEQLAGSSLADAPVVPVSATTGAGLDDLRSALVALLDRAPPPADAGRPRLWVDRVFTVKGAGTVLTGTLGGGAVHQGDELEVVGADRPTTGRVRGLQALGEPRTEVAPGSRTAVNLAGLERQAVARGDAVVRGGQWVRSDRFDAELRLLAGVEVGRRGAWHVHVGSAERLAHLHPVHDTAVTDRGFVRIELDAPLPLQAGDRVVLRDVGRDATVGGGTVLDPLPPGRLRGGAARRTRSRQLADRAAALAAGDRPALLEAHVAERQVTTAADALAAVGLTPEALAQALRRPALMGLGTPPTLLCTTGALDARATAVRAALGDHHRARPLARTAPRDVVTRALTPTTDADMVDAVIGALVERGDVVAEGPGLRLPTHRVALSDEQEQAAGRLVTALVDGGFAPEGLRAAAAQAGVDDALLRELLAAGRLVRLADDLAVPPQTVDAAARVLRDATTGPFTASEARALLGTSRKYALPLLEELDRRGLTRRRGDHRELVRG